MGAYTALFAPGWIALVLVPPLNLAAARAFFTSDFPTAEAHYSALVKLLAGRVDFQPEYTQALYYLGHAQWSQNKLTEAEKNLREALRLRRVILGAKHRDIAITTHNLAQLCCDTGRYREAERFSAMALDALAADDLFLRADVLYTLGLLYWENHRIEDAVRCFQQVIALYPGVALNRNLAVKSHTMLSEIYTRAGKEDVAGKELHKARAVDPHCKIDWPVAVHHLETGAYEKAAGILTPILDDARKREKPIPGQIGKLCAALGEAKARGGDKAAGKKLLTEAVEATEKAYGPDHPRVAAVLETYARLFPDEGKDAAARAAKIRTANKTHEPRGFDAIFGKQPSGEPHRLPRPMP